MTLTAENTPGGYADEGVEQRAADAAMSDQALPDDMADQPGMIDQLKGLYADGRELIDAEVSFQRTRLSAVGKQVRIMALLAVVGLILLGCVLIALTVGTMIALIPILGPWGATGATAGATLVVAVLCFWLAAGRVGRVTALFASSDGDTQGDA